MTRRSGDRARARARSSPSAGDHPPCPGGDRERGHDLPVLRDQPEPLLQVVPALRGGGRCRAAGPLQAALDSPRATDRGRRQDHLPAPELPLRAPEDLDVPEALPRHRDQPLRGLADPQAPGPQPAPGLPALQAPRALASATRSRCPATGPDRREVHRPLRARGKKSYYQFTAIDDCTRLRVLRIYDRCNQKTAIQFARLRPREAALRGRGRSRPTTGPNSSRRSTGTCSTAASATSTSSPPPRGSTARWSDPTGSTTRSSTGCSTASSSTTPSSSTTSSREWENFYNYQLAPTAASAARPPTNDYGKRPRPRCNRSTSVAQPCPERDSNPHALSDSGF